MSDNAALIVTGERYMASVKAVFAIDPKTKKCFAEGSPSKDQETYERFIELSDRSSASSNGSIPHDASSSMDPSNR